MWTKTSALVRTAWILAVYCFAVLVLHAWKPQFTNASQPVRGISDPVIAMQMARNVDEVDNILGDSPSAEREVMRIKQYIDFAFIPGYVALVIVIVEFLSRGRGPTWIFAWRTVETMAVFAGVYDIRENIAILRVVDLTLAQTTPESIHAISANSHLKWAALALATAAMGAMVALTARRPGLRAIGLLALAGAGLTAFGLAQNTLLIWGGMLTVTALLLMAATLKLLTHESVTEDPNTRPVRRSVRQI